MGTIISAKRRAVFFAISAVIAWGVGGVSNAKTWECGPYDKPSAVKATLENGTLRIQGLGEMRGATWAMSNDSLSITDVIIEEGVTSIEDNAFERLKRLKSVKIPNSVTSIGKSAFSGCHSLTSITIPNSVTSIGKDAFNGCHSIMSITIPGSVTSIEERTFSSCKNLKSVTIQNGVKSIEKEAFFRCTSLTSVSIPSSMTIIGESAFDMNPGCCPGLTSIF